MDLGGNIGSHIIPVCSRGYPVWAVEPLTANVVRLYRGVQLSRSLDNFHLFKNTLDRERGKTALSVRKGNVGASRIVAGNPKGLYEGQEEIAAVLLSDIFDNLVAVIREEQRRLVNPIITVVMKVDIESYECRVFLSQSTQERVFLRSDVFIPYILMEWVFDNMNQGHFSPVCPKEKVQEMAQMLTGHGYKPYFKNGIPLNESESGKWHYDCVVWKHKNAVNIWPNRN